MKKRIVMLASLLICAFMGVIAGLFVAKKVINKNDATSENKGVSFERCEYVSDMYDGIIECEYISASFDELIEDSDVIVKGQIIDVDRSNLLYDEYRIRISNTIKGSCKEELRIRNYHYSFVGNDENVKTTSLVTDYKKDCEYIFLVQYISNVYEQYYTILGNVFIDVAAPQNSTFFDKRLEIENPELYIEKSEGVKKEGKGITLSIPYLDGEKISEQDLIDFSDAVLEIDISDIATKVKTSEIYWCKVIDVIDGNADLNNKRIMIAFFPGVVKSGDRCKVYVKQTVEGSVLYTLSSKNSVVSL